MKNLEFENYMQTIECANHLLMGRSNLVVIRHLAYYTEKTKRGFEMSLRNKDSGKTYLAVERHSLKSTWNDFLDALGDLPEAFDSIAEFEMKLKIMGKI